MEHIHQILQQALAPFSPPSDLARYHNLLSRMDWQYEFSDDHSVYIRGKKMLDELRELQKQVDPDGSIWISYPGAKKHGAPQPRSN